MTRAATIVNHLLEAENEFSPEEVISDTAAADELKRDRSPSEIRSLVPNFFSRGNNRFFGTSRTRFYKGNYILVTNRKRSSEHWRSSYTDNVVYKLVHYPDSGWDTKYLGSFRHRDLAVDFIKAHRANPNLTEEEFRQQYTGGHLL